MCVNWGEDQSQGKKPRPQYWWREKKVIRESTTPVEAVTRMQRVDGNILYAALSNGRCRIATPRAVGTPEEEMQGATVAAPGAYTQCVRVPVRVGQNIVFST